MLRLFQQVPGPVDFSDSDNQGGEKDREGEQADGVAERLVAGAGVADVDGGGAGGDGDGDQAVRPGRAGEIECAVEGDAPGGVVAQVEDEVLCVRGGQDEVH